MATKKTVFKKDIFEQLPDELKAVLKANGDNYELEFETAEDVAALRNALQRERTDATNLKNNLSSLQEILGTMKPDEAKQVLEDARKAKEDAAKAAGKWDEYKTQLITEIETGRIKPLETERDEWKTAAEDALITSAFLSALGECNPLPGAGIALLPHATPKVKIVKDDNGKFVARVMTEDGKTPKLDEKGNPISFKNWIEKDFRGSDVFGRHFAASGKTGDAAQAYTGGNGSGGVKTVKASDIKGQQDNLEAIANGEVVVVDG